MSDGKYLVTRFDSPLRWKVSSATRPDREHLVQLEANGGIGRCSCEHFEYRLQPKITEGNRCESSTRCAHIVIARKTFCDFMIQSLVQSLPKNETGETE